MRYRRDRDYNSSEVALTNFALTFAKALLVLCVALFLMINPNQGRDGSKPKAEYLISIEWAGALGYDVDLWTRDAEGHRVSFANKESGVVFLERDDLGNDCRTNTINGGSVNTCQEITVIRGIVPGTYQTAVHLFSAGRSTTIAPVEPVRVAMRVEKLNPQTQIVWQGAVVLDRIRQERAMVQFDIHADGSADDFITDIPPIVYAGKDPS
jgi:hypothetical protein